MSVNSENMAKRNAVEAESIENLGTYFSRLIALNPSLLRFVRGLSTSDLVAMISLVHSQSNSGNPVCAPSEFVSEVEQVVSHKEWKQLQKMLQEWACAIESEVDTLLSWHETAQLVMGLLWETLLISECERRSAEL